MTKPVIGPPKPDIKIESKWDKVGTAAIPFIGIGTFLGISHGLPAAWRILGIVVFDLAIFTILLSISMSEREFNQQIKRYRDNFERYMHDQYGTPYDDPQLAKQTAKVDDIFNKLKKEASK